MKIMMIEVGGWGGLWHYTCCLGNALEKIGCDCQVVTSKNFEIPFELGFKIHPILNKDSSYLRNVLAIAGHLVRTRPDIVHLQSWLSARRDWLAVLICRLLKVPVVVTAHNLLPHDPEERNARYMYASYRAIYAFSAAVIAHSEANKSQLADSFRLQAKIIAVIPHGDYRFFTEFGNPDTGDRFGALTSKGAPKKVFLIFGAIRHYKGVDIAIRALSLIEDLERVHLVVAGKPTEPDTVLQACMSLAGKLGVSGHVSFLPGYYDYAEIANFHRKADLVVFPYRDIFQSGSLQIALAFGKPVIASRVGSFPETLTPDNAWLVEPESPLSLAGAMTEALNSGDEKLLAMGANSLRLSRENHSWKAIAIKTRGLYLRMNKR